MCFDPAVRPCQVIRLWAALGSRPRRRTSPGKEGFGVLSGPAQALYGYGYPRKVASSSWGLAPTRPALVEVIVCWDCTLRLVR